MTLEVVKNVWIFEVPIFFLQNSSSWHGQHFYADTVFCYYIMISSEDLIKMLYRSLGYTVHLVLKWHAVYCDRFVLWSKISTVVEVFSNKVHRYHQVCRCHVEFTDYQQIRKPVSIMTNIRFLKLVQKERQNGVCAQWINVWQPYHCCRLMT